MSDTITVLHPGVEGKGASAASGARRVADAAAVNLKGLRVALLDNTKVHADHLFSAIARRLEAAEIGRASCRARVLILV